MTPTLETWPAITWLWLVEGIAFYALLQWSWARNVPGAQAFRGLAFGSMLYVAAEAFCLVFAEGTARFALSCVSFFGVGLIMPNLTTLFADFTGKNEWLTKRTRVVLYATGLTLGLARCTDPYWGLIYKTETIVHEHGMYLSRYTQGILHYFLMAGIVAAMLLGLVNIALAWREANRLMKRQLVALAASCLFPVVAAVLFNAGVQPLGTLDLTPFALIGTTVLTTWAIFHDRLVEVVPIARNYLVDHFQEGVLVVDETGTVVDSNPALRRMLGLSEKGTLGQPVGEVVKNWPALAEICAKALPGQIELQPAIGGEIFWEATWQPLTTPRDNKRRGWLLVLMDVSARKRTESQLHDLVAERTKEWRDATRNLLRAADEEKRRLGQSLHTTFSQELDRILKDAVALSGASTDTIDPAKQGEKLNQLVRLIADTNHRIQDFASLLEGPDLAHQTFKEALAAALEHLQAALGVRCKLEIAADFPLPSRERARHLIEAVREAVIGSAQPGEAHLVEVILQNQPAGQTVVIRDDGRPRSEKDLSADGRGASQLRLRTTLLNGRLTVRPGKTSGTTIELFVPPQQGSDTAPGFFAT
ncbi:MAG: histidine kinase N-terminal 7TM domain-containing protein [Nibricoccus sp.]